MSFVRIFILFITTFGFSATLWAVPAAFVYQGQIIKPNEEALEASNVTFTIELYSPGVEECLLYQETQIINMTNSNGLFSITIGKGTRAGVDFEDTATLDAAIDNYSGLITPTTCVSVGTYTPAAGDTRKLRVSFDDGNGPITMADQSIQSVPYAQQASSVGGVPLGGLLQTNTTGSNELSQTNVENIFDSANHTKLKDLLAGTSSLYTLGTIAADLDMNGNQISEVGNPLTGTDAANKNYVDQNLGGTAIDTTDLAGLGVGNNGEVLTWDGAGNKWVSSALPGGTMSMDDTYNNGSSVTVDTSDVIFNLSSTQDFHIQDAGGPAFTVLDNGNVGVGIMSPGTLFEISSVSDPTLTIGNLTETGGNSSIIFEAADGAFNNEFQIQYQKNSTSDRLDFIDGGSTTVMSLVNGGSVGIGTASPKSTLDVYGGSMRVTKDEVSSYANLDVRAFTQGGAGGSLIGISRAQGNESTPESLINDDLIGGFYADVYNGTQFERASNIRIAVDDINATGSGNHPGGRIEFKTRGTTETGQYSSGVVQMVVKNNGNVGIGTTSPNAKLQVNGSFHAPGTVVQVVTGSISSDLTGGIDNTWTANLTTLAITPKFSTSKLLVSVANGALDVSDSGADPHVACSIRLVNNSGTEMNKTGVFYGNSSISAITPVTIEGEDSPGTIATQTYGVQMHQRASTACTVRFSSTYWGPGLFKIMEIAQ